MRRPLLALHVIGAFRSATGTAPTRVGLRPARESSARPARTCHPGTTAFSQTTRTGSQAHSRATNTTPPRPTPAQHGSDAHYMHHNSTMHEIRTHGSLSAPEPGRSRRHEALISHARMLISWQRVVRLPPHLLPSALAASLPSLSCPCELGGSDTQRLWRGEMEETVVRCRLGGSTLIAPLTYPNETFEVRGSGLGRGLGMLFCAAF